MPSTVRSRWRCASSACCSRTRCLGAATLRHLGAETSERALELSGALADASLEAVARIAERFLRVNALGDVDGEDDDSDHGAVRVEVRHFVGAHPALLAGCHEQRLDDP